MIRTKLARNGTLQTGLGREEIRDWLRTRDGMLWVDLEMPSDEEFTLLSEVFRFHPLAVEDAHREIELPKVDAYDGYVYLVVHRINVDFEERRCAPREMDIFLSDRYLVTVHDEVSQSVAEVSARIDASPALLTNGPDFVMHDIIDRIVDRYLPVLDHWDEEIDDIEERILLGRPKDDVLTTALQLRRDVANLRKSLGPQRDILQKMARRDVSYISEKAALYFRDVQDHLVGIFNRLETQREHIASLFEAYMATTSSRLSEVMKRLTALATIFLPLSFVAGVYGMNFEQMPGLSLPYGFFYVLALMGGITVGMLWLFKREGWW
jgi:magnesium transporter